MQRHRWIPVVLLLTLVSFSTLLDKRHRLNANSFPLADAVPLTRLVETHE